MKSYAERIVAGGAVALAYESWAEERIDALTAVCTSPSSSVEQIRGAQYGIAEMRRLLVLRETLAEEIKMER